MPPPIVRDVALGLSRSGSAGAQGAIQEAHVTCWTGPAGTHRATVQASYQELLLGGALGPVRTSAPTPPGGFHDVILGDLTPGAYYRFALTAVDADDAAERVTPDHRFTATPGEIPPGPVLSAIAVGALSPVSAQITWTTDAPAPGGQVNYGTTPGLDPLSVASEAGPPPRTDHAVDLAGLTAGTRYYFRVFQVGADGNSTLSSLRSFVTPAA